MSQIKNVTVIIISANNQTNNITMRVGVLVTVVVLVVLGVGVKGYDYDNNNNGDKYKLSTSDLSSFIEFHMRTTNLKELNHMRPTRDLEADNECKKYGCALENESCIGNMFSSPNCTNNWLE